MSTVLDPDDSMPVEAAAASKPTEAEPAKPDDLDRVLAWLDVVAEESAQGTPASPVREADKEPVPEPPVAPPLRTVASPLPGAGEADAASKPTEAEPAKPDDLDLVVAGLDVLLKSVQESRASWVREADKEPVPESPVAPPLRTVASPLPPATDIPADDDDDAIFELFSRDSDALRNGGGHEGRSTGQAPSSDRGGVDRVYSWWQSAARIVRRFAR